MKEECPQCTELMLALEESANLATLLAVTVSHTDYVNESLQWIAHTARAAVLRAVADMAATQQTKKD